MKARTLAKRVGAVLFVLGSIGVMSPKLAGPVGRWQYESQHVLQSKQDEFRTWKKQELLAIDREFNTCLTVRSEPVCIQKAKSAKDVLEITAKEKDDKLTLDSVVKESPKLQENEKKLNIFLLASFVSVIVGLAMFMFIRTKPENKPTEAKVQQVKQGENL